jgi:CheY-like chemotaxis protein
MPGMDGIGVLRALRAGRAQPVPVVVVSAFSPAYGAGGRILTEAEATCTVYCMPRAIEEAGLSHAVLELGELADAIAREVAS